MDGYYWVRVYDYKKDEIEKNKVEDEFLYLDDRKGILLDEFYLKDISSREEAKSIVKSRYTGETAENLLFRKPKDKDGVYAIVMDSEKFFYDRFMTELDTICFFHECHKEIKGKKMFFPSKTIDNESVYFCSYDCLRKCNSHIFSEGEFQEKECGENGNVYGYIYQIYNRATNQYYVGQTKYLPFFRWQEHVKDGIKGNITDMVFLVLSEVRREGNLDNFQMQIILNNIEAWWIHKLFEEGYNAINITKQKITLSEMKEKYNDIIKKIPRFF